MIYGTMMTILVLLFMYHLLVRSVEVTQKIVITVRMKKMMIDRKSPLTGKVNSKELDVTIDQIDAWVNGELIQDVMPHLSPADREFLMTGMLDDEFDSLFKEE